MNTIKQQDSSYRVRSVPYYDQYFTYFTYDDNNYLIATPENDYRHVIYDYKKEDYIEIPYLSSLSFTKDKSLLSSIYRPATAVNEEKRIFASSHLLLGEFDLFNFNGELIKYFIKSFAVDWSKGDIIGYCAGREQNNIVIYKINPNSTLTH